MTENEKTISLGKKVFFLHPSVFVQNQIISELAQEEFEVYIIKDADKLQQALKNYPDSVFFASIDETMKEDAWDKVILAVQKNTSTEGVNIGIIASTDNEAHKSKYLEKMKVSCGFTVIKADASIATKQLITILNSVNAKGRRKYVRIVIDKETNATLNISIEGDYINGNIKDISVVGFSCSFQEDPELPKNGLFSDIQLKLQSQLLKVEGIVFGSRMDGGEKIYVILFSQRMDSDSRSKIRKFIQANLQNRMEHELK